MTVVAYGVDHGVDGPLNVVKGDRIASLLNFKVWLSELHRKGSHSRMHKGREQSCQPCG